jgi:polyphosphate kinase 2 (PPK2 family)
MENGDESRLADVDLTQRLSKKAYKQIRKDQLERLYELENECFDRGISVIIVFEGWDAAGKGTAIRTLTQRLDPRGFKVLATQAPRTYEKQKPWLWRFWMDIPRRGQMAIFDRSWYGRVLVERVEGLTPIPDWIRAYEEINAFEHTLADDGTVIVKFWLHIPKDEQLRRFVSLTQDPSTAWEVTAEDWENHRKHDEYEAAVEDMLSNTDTEYAPWDVVPSTHKHYKTYYIFSTIIARLEEALGYEITQWPAPAELEKAIAKGKSKKDKVKKDKAKKDKAKKDKVKGEKKGKKKKKKNGSKAKVGDNGGMVNGPAVDDGEVDLVEEEVELVMVEEDGNA